LLGAAAGPGGEAAAALGAASALGLVEELSWLAEVAQRRKPFAATVHCLCGPVE